MASVSRNSVRWLVGLLLVFTFSRWPSMEGWDDAFYVAQLTSALGDGDLVLQNDLQTFPNPIDLRLRTLRTVLPDGALFNTFSVGPALVHATYTWPLFIAGAKPMVTLRAAIGLGSIALLSVCVLAIRSLLLRAGHRQDIATTAAVLAIVSGPLALYGTRTTLGSHLLSATFAALLVLALVRWVESPTLERAALAGAIAGVLVVVRWQDILFVGAVGVALLLWAAPLSRPHWSSLGLMIPPFALAVACQALSWRAQFGSVFLVPQGRAYMHWTAPQVAALLFSTFHGLLPWAPVFGLGLATAWLGAVGRGPLPAIVRFGFPIATIVTIYLSASVTDWWGGESFGPRRLASLAVVAAFGIAAVASRCDSALRVVLVVATCAWATFTVTAQLSGFDDLRVLVDGRIDARNPFGSGPYARARWIDAGTWWPHVLRPGFSMSDHPRPVDRAVGFIAAALVYSIATTGWHLVARSRAAEKALAIMVVGWLSVAAGWLALRVQTNREANGLWRAVALEGGEPPASMPYGLGPPASVVAAARALERGDAAAFARFARGIGPDGPSAEDLLRHVKRKTAAEP